MLFLVRVVPGGLPAVGIKPRVHLPPAKVHSKTAKMS